MFQRSDGWKSDGKDNSTCRTRHTIVKCISNPIHQTRNTSTHVQRKGRSVFLLLPLTAFGLGTWQVYRYQWKVGIMEEVEKKSHLPPVILEDSILRSVQPNKSHEDMGVVTQQDLDYRVVQSTGKYLYDQEVLIGPRQHQGQNGFHVVTPFQTREGTKILVNRGWIPSSLKDPQSRTQYRVAENVTVQGMLRKTTPKANFVPENEPERGMWYWIDIPALANYTKSVPLLVDLSGDNSNQSLPIPAGIKYNMLHPKDHLGYAATWYSLAIGLSIMSRLFLRK